MPDFDEGFLTKKSGNLIGSFLENKKVKGLYQPFIDRIRRITSSQTKSELLQFQVLHRLKLGELKRKVAEGKKIRVIFLNLMLGQFGFDSIYKAMEKSNLFDPYILVLNPWENSFKKDILNKDPTLYSDAVNNFNFFKLKGYKTLFGYDEDKNPIDIELFSPDIIFYNDPNLIYPSTFHRNIHLNLRYLTCYLTYSMNTLGNFDYHYNNYYINSAWINFSETRYSFFENINKSRFSGYNAVLSGYPKLDRYAEEIDRSTLPKKVQKASKIVIYAPHWSIRNEHFDLNLSTFHLYFEKMEQLRDANPNILFVFKPHPMLIRRIRRLGEEKFIGLKKYLEYVERWNNSDNGIFINDGEYIDIFKVSDCLITDCGSFIAEYLVSGHPCIYLFNPERVHPWTQKYVPMFGVNEFGKKILKSYYCCNNQSELDKYFDDVVIKGNDPKYEERQKIIKSDFYNIGVAGEYICKYLEKILTG